MFGPLGGPELLLILVLALIVFGPRKLPEVGKSMGKMLAEFRKASTEFKRTIEDEVEAENARTYTPPPSLGPPGTPEAPAATEAGAEIALATPAEPAEASEPTVSRQEPQEPLPRETK